VPAASPALVVVTVAVVGPVPDAGLTASQEASGVAVQVSVPLPLFEMPSDCCAGFGPPTDAANERLVGLTARVGPSTVLPYAEIGPSLYCLPVPVHVAGSVASVFDELSSVNETPPPQQRSRKASVPFDARSATQ